MDTSNTSHSNPGWAIYVYIPEDSQPKVEAAKKRLQAMLDNSDMPVFGEYIDNPSADSGNARPELERLMEDARLGKFSHALFERPECASRSDTEALTLIDDLAKLGVQVRFANYPDIDPLSPDGRPIISMSFTLAWRESKLLSPLASQTLESRQQNGGYIGKAPDGYMYVLDDMPNRKNHARRS